MSRSAKATKTTSTVQYDRPNKYCKSFYDVFVIIFLPGTVPGPTEYFPNTS